MAPLERLLGDRAREEDRAAEHEDAHGVSLSGAANEHEGCAAPVDHRVARAGRSRAPSAPSVTPVGPDPHVSADARADRCGFRQPAGETRSRALRPRR
ncbi:hypothetical protein GCM10009719_31660 [Nocardioides kribbensis]